MIRPSRRVMALCLLGLGISLAPSAASAQVAIGDITADPFAFYYAFYLPNQQMQAMRPRPDDAINQAVQQRQYYAAQQRRSLYNPISPYTDQEYDPLRPYSRQQGEERIARVQRFTQDPSNAHGTGPSLYYGRASQYFPTLRMGRGPNANVGPGNRRIGGGGGFGGMGGMPGMPGMGW